MAYNPIQPGGPEALGGASQPGRAGSAKPADGADFKQFLRENLDKVNQMQAEADTAVEGLLTGQETDITKVMGAVEKADVAFQTLMAVRNKLVESYQEVLRMRI